MEEIPVVRVGKKKFPCYQKAIEFHLKESSKVKVQASGKICQMGCYLAAVFQDLGHTISDIKIGLNKVEDTSYTTLEYIVHNKNGQ